MADKILANKLCICQIHQSFLSPKLPSIQYIELNTIKISENIWDKVTHHLVLLSYSDNKAIII